MPSIFDFLSGGLGGEDDYLARDPFFGAAQSIGSWNLRPQSDAEAIYGPAVQGLLGGLLGGYGRRNATETAYEDYSSRLNSPLFQSSGLQEMLSGDYSSEAVPENWSPKVGQSDLMLAAIMAQSQQEAAAKKAEMLAKYSPEVLAGEEGLAAAKARGAAEVESAGAIPGIPKALQPKAIQEAQTLAQKEQTLNFVDAEFERSKDLIGVSAMLSGISPVSTKKGEALQMINTGIISHIDKVHGREASDKVRNYLATGGPNSTDWNESTIDEKKANFKNFLSSLFDATPVLQGAGLVPETVSPVVAPTAQQPIPPGMKLQRNPRTGETRIVPQ